MSRKIASAQSAPCAKPSKNEASAEPYRRPQRWSPSKSWRPGGSCTRPAGLPRGGRGAVRLLHAGTDRRERGLLRAQRRSPTEAEIREALAGNLCRCTGYEKILDAVRLASASGSM